jgi:transcriptional regulator with XRE-family HTH domain
MKPLGELIADLRKARQMSQTELAARLNVSRVAVTKWENGGTQNLKLANLVALCRLFAVSADSLLRAELSYNVGNTQDCVELQVAENASDYKDRDEQHVRTLMSNYLDLTDEGRRLVDVKIVIAVETAKNLHGTRDGSAKTAA